MKQPEFQRAEFDALPRNADAVGGRGQSRFLATLHFEALRIRRFVAPQKRANPRNHFARAERLRDVVVCADLQPHNAVCFLTSSR